MDIELERIAEKLADRLKRHQLKGRTITLKIRFNDFSIINRSKSLPHNLDDFSIILQTAKELLSKELSTEDKRVRLLGITLSNFTEITIIDRNPKQLRLF